ETSRSAPASDELWAVASAAEFDLAALSPSVCSATAPPRCGFSCAPTKGHQNAIPSHATQHSRSYRRIPWRRRPSALWLVPAHMTPLSLLALSFNHQLLSSLTKPPATFKRRFPMGGLEKRRGRKKSEENRTESKQPPHSTPLPSTTLFPSTQPRTAARIAGFPGAAGPPPYGSSPPT